MVCTEVCDGKDIASWGCILMSQPCHSHVAIVVCGYGDAPELDLIN